MAEEIYSEKFEPMKRLAWLSDIHLDSVQESRIAAFCKTVVAAGPDAVIISGDIGEAHDCGRFLHMLEQTLARPIYFVLGNHDYYGGSIERVRAATKTLVEKSKLLNWLTIAGPIALTDDTGILGHDGWADARAGDYAHSTVMLNDYLLIKELSGLSLPVRRKRLQALGDQAAAYVRDNLPEALERFRKIIFVTHVPPFQEACWHMGKTSGDDWLPHFTCQAAGQALLAAMRARPDRDMTVLCGHTHSSGFVRMLPNLEVYTGSAEYGAPVIQRMIEI